MGMMQKVLVPLTVHEEGDLICDYVSGMTANGTTDAVLANVVDPTGLESPVVATMLDIARDHMRAMVDPIERASIRTEYRVDTGTPGVELSHLAARGEFTGMVIGTHGRSEWAKVFQGSVATELLSRVKIPMMLVRFDLLRNAEHAREVARDFSRTIVVACDFSASSTRAVLALLDMGLPKVGQLFLVHVIDPSVTGEALQEAEKGAAYELKHLVEMLKASKLDAHIVIRQGEPARELLDEIDDRRATGVVMGARGRTIVEAAVLGSKSGAVVAQAPCPVIVVP